MDWISKSGFTFLSADECASKVKKAGYKYMGLQWGQGGTCDGPFQCFGSNDLSKTTKLGCCDPNPSPLNDGTYNAYGTDTKGQHFDYSSDAYNR